MRVCMLACLYDRMNACMYVCVYLCVPACMYVFMWYVSPVDMYKVYSITVYVPYCVIIYIYVPMPPLYVCPPARIYECLYCPACV